MLASPALRCAAPVLVLGLVLASLTACGGTASSAAGPSGAAADAATSSPSTWPLTGLPAPNGASVLTHPVYVAKIDNTYASDPQYGLSKADLVTEELVEGGITRLAVFFYSDLPAKVGPIRSMRLTDIGLAEPLGATLIASGAAPVTLAGLKQAGATYDDMDDPNIRRVLDGTHDVLHSVEADVAKIGAEAGQAPARPQDFFTWGTDAAFPGTSPATSITARFSAGSVDQWSYTGGGYVLQNGYMAKGDAYHPDTIIAATVRTTSAPYKDPAGNPVPVTDLTGSGSALVFHHGEVVKATWSKASAAATLQFTLPDGSPLAIPAGHVWLELIPQGGASVGAGSVTWTP